jgi:hypothetical protein
MSPAANIQVCKPRQRQKDRPAIIPCKLLISDIEFLAWVSQAEPGDRLAYHRGFLAVDCDMTVGNLSAEDRKTLGNLAHKARGAFEVGLVDLVQERLGVDRFAYIAIARSKPKSKATAASLSALLLNEAA